MAKTRMSRPAQSIPSTTTVMVEANNQAIANKAAIDYPSQINQFGWEKLAENFAIPVLLRFHSVRYAPVKIVEQEIIKKYETIPQNVFSIINIKSFYMTTAEAKLMNSINFNHCDAHYGDTFFSARDVMITASDVRELSRFLEVTRKIHQNYSEISHTFGIIIFYPEPKNLSRKISIPYVSKYMVTDNNKPTKFIPAKLVDPFVTNILCKSVTSDWDTMYLKMLALFSDCAHYLPSISKESYIIKLDGLCYKSNSGPVMYEEYKPCLQNNLQLQQQANWQQTY